MRLKILILKPSSLGDVTHALPVLRILKQRYPYAEIHWLIADNLAPLLAGDPDLEKLHIFHRRNWFSPTGAYRLLCLIWDLRREGFDWVIDLQGLARSAWLGCLVQGRWAIGVDSGREGARAFNDLSVCRRSPKTHAVDWCLDVIRAMGIDSSGDYIWLPKRLPRSTSLLDPRYMWIVLCPGARWPSKCWPLDYFVSLAAKFRFMGGRIRIAILGTIEDLESGEAIFNAAPNVSLNLVGKTTLPEMLECLSFARVVVANDSGPLHLAVALNRPLVALYGPTHPERTGPYGRSSSVIQAPVPCSPCQLPNCNSLVQGECMRGISPDVVANAILAKL